MCDVVLAVSKFLPWLDRVKMATGLPPSFKPLQHYLKAAAEHDKRDPVVAYYCE